MSLRELALQWRVDGSTGLAFLALICAVGAIYLAAARHGERRDRRGRRWPRRRSGCFIAGLLALAIDLYSGIGVEADVRLSAHMVEHMMIWVVVAPLLAAGAPVRLAFYSLRRRDRRALARCLRSRAVATFTSPVVCVCLFSAVVLGTHLPAVYGLALSNEYIHEGEHGLYLLTALFVWVPLLGIDPLPHRPSTRSQLASMVACMLPMLLVALWLRTTPSAVYGHYLGTLGKSALDDQRLAATIMWAGGLPAFAVPLVRSLRPRQPWRLAQLHSQQAPT
jgi:putative membrane protein